MDREILFRGKRTNGNGWAYGIPAKHSDESWRIRYGFSDDGRFAKVIPESISQYTGLIDENGNKIFEGDIIRRKLFGEGYAVGQIVWNDIGVCGYCLKSGDNLYPIGKAKHTGRAIDDEVIGNIFDNPELLKGATQ